jgi:2'-5' RNA ligase
MSQHEVSYRLFVALDLPETWRTALQSLQIEMQDTIAERFGLAVRPRWVRPDGIHLTLKFLGETPTSRLDVLKTQLAQAVPDELSFNLSLGRVGSFEQRRSPRVILATVAVEGRALIDLYERIETWLSVAGWPREKRSFHPHLTLARLPQGMDDATRRAVADLTTEFGAPQAPVWHVDRVYLIRSHLGTGGARYEHIAAFPA